MAAEEEHLEAMADPVAEVMAEVVVVTAAVAMAATLCAGRNRRSRYR